MSKFISRVYRNGRRPVDGAASHDVTPMKEVPRLIHCGMHAYYARPSLPEDADFLYAVYETTARHLVEGSGLRWPEGRMRDKCKSDAASGNTQILLASDESVGFFSLEERADEVWLEALFILPEHQRRGIGTHLVIDALSRALQKGIPVRCQVMEFNPAAMAFYKQFGFVEYQTGKRCVFLQSTTYGEVQEPGVPHNGGIM